MLSVRDTTNAIVTAAVRLLGSESTFCKFMNFYFLIASLLFQLLEVILDPQGWTFGDGFSTFFTCLMLFSAAKQGKEMNIQPLLLTLLVHDNLNH